MVKTGIAKLEHYGLLLAAGDDARAFLHAQLTNDLEQLAPARARFAGWCTAKGRLLATFLVVPCAGGFLLQLSRDLVPAVLKRLSMFILRSKVKLTDVSGQWTQFGVWDSSSVETLAVAEIDGGLRVALEPGRTLVLADAYASGRYAPAAPEADRALAAIRA